MCMCLLLIIDDIHLLKAHNVLLIDFAYYSLMPSDFDLCNRSEPAKSTNVIADLLIVLTLFHTNLCYK